MDASDFVQVLAVLGALMILAPALGYYMHQVYDDSGGLRLKPLRWLESLIYRVGGIRPQDEMTWKNYAAALLVFNFCGFLVLLVILVAQGQLPLNPSNFPGLEGWLAVNTAISFVTNTNWQAYAGESSLSHLSQMLGLGVQNFLSAGTGMAVAVALGRGLSRKSVQAIGNFWVDLTRSVIYVLLPISLILAAILVSQGVIQNFAPQVVAKLYDGTQQILPMGPAASQVAIKQIGTNGGGFFGANSAHPFENPTPLSNILQILGMLLIPASTPFMFGRILGHKRHGYALFGAMLTLFLACLGAALWSESLPNSIFQNAVNLEGKEVRFGATTSVLWSVASTATSTGSVNSMISSLSPLTGGLAMLNIMLGEIIFGGVGSGLYGMVMFVVLTVFIAGLMVGRSPEYLGKKIEAREIKLAMVAVIVPSALILGGAALACSTAVGLSSLLSKGPHGLSEILYAFTSASGNNGSSFGGLNANTPFYNGTLGLCMLLGRFCVIVPVLGIAGSLAEKNITPPSQGTFPVDGGLFVFLLLGIIVIIGALTFFPALTLGPIVEHLLMVAGRTF